MNKAVIFDLDGTLIDSLEDLNDSVNAMLSHFGYPSVTIENTRQNIGDGARNLVKRSIPVALSDSELDECLAYYSKVYNSCGCPKTKPFDGITELVAEIKSRGFKVAILTNKPHTSTLNVYNEYLSHMQFDMVVGASEFIKHKPDPQGVRYILNALAVKPENAYFIGDGEADVQTAIDAGIKCIAVLWGNRTKSQLLESGATLFANDCQELLSQIK